MFQKTIGKCLYGLKTGVWAPNAPWCPRMVLCLTWAISLAIRVIVLPESQIFNLLDIPLLRQLLETNGLP
jgi:hypothetical protein